MLLARIAIDGNMKHCGLAGSKRSPELQIGRADLQRLRIALDACAPQFAIEAFVGHQNRAWADLVGQAASPMIATDSTHLEDVGEVCRERDSKRNVQMRLAVID